MENKSIITNEELKIDDFCISTREVAEMMGREHKRVLRRLEGDATHIGIIPTLIKAQIKVDDFFKKSTYIDAKGESRKEYLCTEKGCDMLLNKATGKKGILLSAKYIK